MTWSKAPRDIRKPFCHSHHWLKPHNSSTFHSQHLCPRVCCVVCLVSQPCLTLRPRGLQPVRLLCPWGVPGKNTGVGCHALLQGSSQPRDGTQVSQIADRFFTVWARLLNKGVAFFFFIVYFNEFLAASILKQLFFLRCLVKSVSRSVVSDSLWPHGLYLARVLCPWDSPGKNTRVCCHALLQGIFPTQGLIPGLRHCGQILYHLSYQGSPQSKWKCELLSLVKEPVLYF